VFARRRALAIGFGAAIAPAILSTARAQTTGGVLVFGASGSSGSEFIKHLPATTPVTAFVRPTSNRDRLSGREVTFVTGDVLNVADVAKAFDGRSFNTVFVALQSRRGEPNPYVGAARNITTYAKANGVKQIIWIGQVGSSATTVNQADYPDINFKLFGETLEFMSAAERIIVESGMPYTIIRVGAIIVERGKPPQPETGQGRLVDDVKQMGAIAYGDLGRLASACAGNKACINKTFHTLDDTLSAQYKHWRCRRFATPETIDAC